MKAVDDPNDRASSEAGGGGQATQGKQRLFKTIIVVATVGALGLVAQSSSWLRTEDPAPLTQAPADPAPLTQTPVDPVPEKQAPGEPMPAEPVSTVEAPDSADGQIAATAGRRPPWEIPGTTLDEPTVNELLPNIASGGWLQYDPVAIVRPIPHQSKTVTWPEHPDGELVISTNNMGFREDEDTEVQTEAHRIIVIGDSHTFGLVNQSESFANVLERRLLDDGDGAYEVINAGVSGTGPFEYEGSVGRFLGLDPDVMVVVFYAGNDFSNAMAFSDFFSKRRWPPLPIEAKKLIDDARKVERERMAQSLTQTFDYSWRPSNGYTGLAASIERLGVIATMCRDREVGLLVALLPTKEDADAVIDAEHIAELAGLLDLSVEDMGINQRLTALLDTALRKVGVKVLDLQAPLKAITDRRLYWIKDHHLNVDGHAAVAESLEAPVRELLEERQRALNAR